MKYLAVLFALFLLVVIILADAGRLGFLRGLYDFSFGDKAGHFILYGILSFLLNKTFLRSLASREPKRVVDLIFSYLGAAAGAWAARRSEWHSDLR